MKSKLYDSKGKEKGTMEFPKQFTKKIRPDILLKVYEAQKGLYMQAVGAMPGAGAQYSASGISKKRRHVWKGTYGKGISRIPRKIMSRHGASFNWIGATVSSTRGGRSPHAPKAEKNLIKKINKKELALAYSSALAGTVDTGALEAKYGKKIPSGLVFDSKILTLKTKEFFTVLKAILGDTFSTVIKKRQIRAGRGKMRGRKYKTNAGLLFVIGSGETMNRSGVDVVPVQELTIVDLAPNGVAGRITAYTEEAIKEIGAMK